MAWNDGPFNNEAFNEEASLSSVVGQISTVVGSGSAITVRSSNTGRINTVASGGGSVGQIRPSKTGRIGIVIGGSQALPIGASDVGRIGTVINGGSALPISSSNTGRINTVVGSGATQTILPSRTNRIGTVVGSGQARPLTSAETSFSDLIIQFGTAATIPGITTNSFTGSVPFNFEMIGLYDVDGNYLSDVWSFEVDHPLSTGPGGREVGATTRISELNDGYGLFDDISNQNMTMTIKVPATVRNLDLIVHATSSISDNDDLSFEANGVTFNNHDSTNNIDGNVVTLSNVKPVGGFVNLTITNNTGYRITHLNAVQIVNISTIRTPIGVVTGYNKAQPIQASKVSRISPVTGSGSALLLGSSKVSRLGVVAGAGQALSLGASKISRIGTVIGTGNARPVFSNTGIRFVSGSGQALPIRASKVSRLGVVSGSGQARPIRSTNSGQINSVSGVGSVLPIRASKTNRIGIAQGSGQARSINPRLSISIGLVIGTGFAQSINASKVGRIGTVIGNGVTRSLEVADVTNLGNWTIRKVIETELKNWAENRGVPIDISWENVSSDFEKPYLESYMFPSDPEVLTVDGVGHTRFKGYFQFNVVVDRWTSVYQAEQIAAEICKLFPADSFFQTKGKKVWVTRPPTVKRIQVISDVRASLNSDDATMPVFVYYQMDAI